MSLPAAIGVARLARFRAEGLAAFDATPVGLLNALAPWCAFALVGFLLVLLDRPPGEALLELLATLVALLTPPVLSEAVARYWRRDAGWLRYAVALTWCQWLMPPAFLLAVLASGILIASGVSEDLAEHLGMLALLAYALALHGFIARHALALSRWRTAAIVVVVNLGTAALVSAPLLVGSVLEGTPA